MTEENYKIKYLKYKNKYLELRKSLINQQSGGGPLSTVIGKEEFYARISSTQPIGVAYLIKFVDLFQSLAESNRLNILIGAANVYNYDFERFKDSNYSLFIDDFTINIDKYKDLYKERLYDMFTISNSNNDYETKLNNNFLSNRFSNKVNMFCTDVNTAYFLNKDIYINLASKILKPGGKFIFHHAEKLVRTHVFEGNKLIYLLGRTYVSDEYAKLFTIDTTNKTIKIIGDDNIKTIFTDLNLLAPSFPIKIMDRATQEYYEDNLYEAYLRYFQLVFDKVFTSELKTFTYMNFTYPVPNSYKTTLRKFVHFIISRVMTEEERAEYLTTNTLTDRKLNELIGRVNNSKTLQTLTSEIKEGYVFNADDFRTNVISQFKEIYYYYELTKI